MNAHLNNPYYAKLKMKASERMRRKLLCKQISTRVTCWTSRSDRFLFFKKTITTFITAAFLQLQGGISIPALIVNELRDRPSCYRVIVEEPLSISERALHGHNLCGANLLQTYEDIGQLKWRCMCGLWPPEGARAPRSWLWWPLFSSQPSPDS